MTENSWSVTVLLLSRNRCVNTAKNRNCFIFPDFLILIKSCSIESRNDPSPKSEVMHETKFSLRIFYSTHVCLAQLDQHQTCIPVMVSVLSSSPTGGNFIFLRHLKANLANLYKNDRNVRFVLFTNLHCPVKTKA